MSKSNVMNGYLESKNFYTIEQNAIFDLLLNGRIFLGHPVGWLPLLKELSTASSLLCGIIIY